MNKNNCKITPTFELYIYKSYFQLILFYWCFHIGRPISNRSCIKRVWFILKLYTGYNNISINLPCHIYNYHSWTYYIRSQLEFFPTCLLSMIFCFVVVCTIHTEWTLSVLCYFIFVLRIRTKTELIVVEPNPKHTNFHFILIDTHYIQILLMNKW